MFTQVSHGTDQNTQSGHFLRGKKLKELKIYLSQVTRHYLSMAGTCKRAFCFLHQSRFPDHLEKRTAAFIVQVLKANTLYYSGIRIGATVGSIVLLHAYDPRWNFPRVMIEFFVCLIAAYDPAEACRHVLWLNGWCFLFVNVPWFPFMCNKSIFIPIIIAFLSI